MKTLIDLFVASIISIAVFQGGKYGLKQTVAYIQGLALEKAVQGLGDLEPTTQKMTGERLDF